MIKFEKFTLDNGLRILIHEDFSTPLAAMNLLYDVGARDEDPELTGIAHLFEHLMFGGSVNIPDYDKPLQMVGGENNAFTNNDITNYYLTVPAENIETGFWLEADRMYELDFSQKNLDTQKSVVTEEYNQRYINQPYGDAILLLKPLSYKVHPYRWPAIGRDIQHVSGATLDDIRSFFYSHYAPNNAVLTIAGNVKTAEAIRLARKWFGPIPSRQVPPRILPAEPAQNEERRLTAERDVPSDALFKTWHIGPRLSPDYSTLDLLTDLLAGGESGRLYTRLVRGKKMFSEINAYITSDFDPGLVVLHGRLMEGITLSDADYETGLLLDELKNGHDLGPEIEKVRNKYESSTVFSNTSILHKAVTLAQYELLGDPDMINREVGEYRKVTQEMIAEAARKYFTPSNCSTLMYKSIRKG
jgi:predicted Zn-dependent peptidase